MITHPGTIAIPSDFAARAAEFWLFRFRVRNQVFFTLTRNESEEGVLDVPNSSLALRVTMHPETEEPEYSECHLVLERFSVQLYTPRRWHTKRAVMTSRHADAGRQLREYTDHRGS